jgi:hypothetical protein
MFYFPFKDPTVADRLAKGLLKAGLPGETSGYYKVSAEDRLSGEEIRSLFFGRTRSGFDLAVRFPMWKDTTENGKTTMRRADRPGDTIGTSWIENNMLCERFYDIVNIGLEECGPVFRNPSGSEKMKNEYLWMTDCGIWEWSLAK